MTGCGLGGIGANLSTTTFLGGGGNGFPEMVMTCCGMHGGGHGGASRMTRGSGVQGLGGC